MKTVNKRSEKLNELRAALAWRLEEFRLTDDAVRLLEIRQEIRLLKQKFRKLGENYIIADEMLYQ